MANTINSQFSQADAQGLIQLFKAGKHKEAQAKARKYLKKNPRHPFLYDLLGKSLIAEGNLSGAVKPLEKLLELQPENADGEYNLALAYMSLNKPESAAGLLEGMVERGMPSADIHTNLGAAYFELERFEMAIRNYEKALELDPKFIPALRNIGSGLRTLRRYDESLQHLEKVVGLAPGFAAGHLSLGITLSRLGEVDRARSCIEKALVLEPENREALYEMGVLHAAEGNHEAAISCYEKVDTAEARVKVLEHLHAIGDAESEVISRLKTLCQAESGNLRAAAFSAYISNQYRIEEPHFFAPDPLGFVSIGSIRDVLDDNPEFLKTLIHEAETVNAVWENNTTRGGYQTHGNLFQQGGALGELETLLRQRITRYREERRGANAGIIRNFPKKFDMDGWHVKLMKAGYQKPHIHTRGWVSGVLYLKIPRNTKGNEGAIAFSLHGYEYRKVHEDIPFLQHKPSEGDLVLFPSSLFHHTIPFESDEDRQCIAFDVLPIREKN